MMPVQSGFTQSFSTLTTFISRWFMRPILTLCGILSFLFFAPVVHAGILDLEWIAPTTNADNPPTSLTDLSGYRVYSAPSPGPAPCPSSTFQAVAAARPDPQPTDLPVTSQLTGLITGTTYFVQVTAVDTSGNESICSTEASAPARADTIPPTVSISSPSNGAFVRGITTVTATATDNEQVMGVRFLVDGTDIGPEDTTAPYSIPWTTVGNGARTLTAIARDTAGNTTTSSPVSVTVDNTPPTVNITAPVSGATVSGTVTISATASDNTGGSGIAGVQFQVDGTNVGAEDTSAPFSFPWNSATVSNGSHILTAVARDAVGNTTPSSAVTVTVSNPPTISTTTLPAATVGVAYSQALTATGGTPPYTWSRVSGTLPAGLTLSAGGVISGTPTTQGTSTFTVRVTDAAAVTDDQQLSLTVNAPPPPGPAPTSDSEGGGGGGCFIATAAYGSALEPQVVLLRAFRDQYLLTNPLGHAFVQWYYHTSPPVAEAIRQSPTLRSLVRLALWPLVGVAWLSLHPGVGIGVILVGGGGLAGGIWQQRRRRGQPAK